MGNRLENKQWRALTLQIVRQIPPDSLLTRSDGIRTSLVPQVVFVFLASQILVRPAVRSIEDHLSRRHAEPQRLVQQPRDEQLLPHDLLGGEPQPGQPVVPDPRRRRRGPPEPEAGGQVARHGRRAGEAVGHDGERDDVEHVHGLGDGSLAVQDAEHVGEDILPAGGLGGLVVVGDAHPREAGGLGLARGLTAAAQGVELLGDGPGLLEARVAEQVGEVAGVLLERGEVDAVGEAEVGFEDRGGRGRVSLARPGLGEGLAGGLEGGSGGLEGHVQEDVALGGDGDHVGQR